jgi:hypothetical protein
VAARCAPETLDNIERIPFLEPEVLDREHIRRGRPVILTRLFADAPVARLADPAVALAELGDLALPVRANPIPEYVHGRPPPRYRTVRFGTFYRELATRRTREFCIEHDTPDALARHIPLPPHMALGEPDDGWDSHIFMAGPGSATHLHFDADLRSVLTHQVLGRKRYVLIDPRHTRKLAPGTPPGACYASALHLDHFSDADLTGFLRYVDAWDCILEPGETLLTPATTWHYPPPDPALPPCAASACRPIDCMGVRRRGPVGHPAARTQPLPAVPGRGPPRHQRRGTGAGRLLPRRGRGRSRRGRGVRRAAGGGPAAVPRP